MGTPASDARGFDLPVAFQFAVALGRRSSPYEAAFREVSGIATEMDVEPVQEGGENAFVHQLPKGVKPGRLTLKRGIARNGTHLVDWCRCTLEGGLAKPILPRLVHVFLLDAEGSPLRSWAFFNAYPVKWSIDAFDALRNEVALETIELVHSGSKKLG